MRICCVCKTQWLFNDGVCNCGHHITVECCKGDSIEYIDYCGALDLRGRECDRAVSGNLRINGIPMCKRHYRKEVKQ